MVFATPGRLSSCGEEGGCGVCTASDLVNIKTTFPKCALLVADRNASKLKIFLYPRKVFSFIFEIRKNPCRDLPLCNYNLSKQTLVVPRDI